MLLGAAATIIYFYDEISFTVQFNEIYSQEYENEITEIETLSMTHRSKFAIALLLVLACGLITFYDQKILGITLFGTAVIIYIYDKVSCFLRMRDEALFKQPPPNEDCPICMLPLPKLETGAKYRSCCGKIICSGCIRAVAIRDRKAQKCPLCRKPMATSKEILQQTKKRMEIGDADAIYSMGGGYYHGLYGMPQDYTKALELWHRAGELGHAEAYSQIGGAYCKGNGLERDTQKAKHYWELAAIRGSNVARHNLGANTCNCNIALKHFMIAAGGGEKRSLDIIQKMFKKGVATKEDYTQALRAYQAHLDKIRSPQRDEAAAFDEQFKYY